MGNSCGVYVIQNKVNGKVYVGSSVAAKNRINGHKSLLSRNKHYNRCMQSEYNQYGLGAFEFTIVESEIDPSELSEREKHYTERLKSNAPEFGYNARPNVNSNLGVKLSQESKERIRESKLGEKNPFFNKSHTKESRKKMSESRKGKNSYWYGKELPDYVKKKISNTLKGKMSGENNPVAKINYQIACEIRSHLDGGVAVKDIAANYGVSTSTIYNIKLNRSWLMPNN
jgi:group I intron endonuclease